MGAIKKRNGKDLTEAEEIKTGKGQFSFQSQRRARPKNFKLPYNCTHLTC